MQRETDHVTILIIISGVVGQIAQGGCVQHARVDIACGIGRGPTEAGCIVGLCAC